MVNNAASGERGGGRGYVLYTVHRPSAYVIRCTCISMQSLSFKCIALCILKFSIYQNNYQGKCWPWYSCIISKHVCKTKSVN